MLKLYCGRRKFQSRVNDSNASIEAQGGKGRVTVTVTASGGAAVCRVYVAASSTNLSGLSLRKIEHGSATIWRCERDTKELKNCYE
jgi:hypothetical protein